VTVPSENYVVGFCLHSRVIIIITRACGLLLVAVSKKTFFQNVREKLCFKFVEDQSKIVVIILSTD